MQKRVGGGHIFGGYTQAKWHSNDEWVADPNAFLFSIDKRHLIRIKNDRTEGAIGCFANRLCCYGWGIDLILYDSCNEKNDQAWSNLGWTYEAPFSTVYDEPSAKEYF